MHPIEAARAGAVNPVPLIVGTNSHEASMFACSKPPMLPTTVAGIDDYFDRVAPEARDRVLAAYPDYPRRRALIAVGSDVMFGAPTWSFADAYSAHAPTHVYRFDHAAWQSAGAGPRRHARQRDRAHPAQLRLVHRAQAASAGPARAAVGRPPHAAHLAGLRHRAGARGLAAATTAGDAPPASSGRRATSSVEDPDAVRRAAWAGLY